MGVVSDVKLKEVVRTWAYSLTTKHIFREVIRQRKKNFGSLEWQIVGNQKMGELIGDKFVL